MRIALAVHAFPPRSVAGVELATLRLAKQLQSLGDEVLVLAAAHDLAARPRSLREREQEGVRVVEVVNTHDRGTLRSTWDDPELEQAVAPALERFSPQVVHFQHLLNLSTGLVRRASEQRAAVVLTLHDYWLTCPRDGLRIRADLQVCETVDLRVCSSCLANSPYLVPRLQSGLASIARRSGLGPFVHRLHQLSPGFTSAVREVLRWSSAARGEDLEQALRQRTEGLREALSSVDLCLAPTRFAARVALEASGSEVPWRLVPNGVGESAPRPFEARPRRRFLYLGTLAPHKGVHVLIRAFRRVASPEATLVIQGNPSLDPEYASQLRQLASGDARIRFAGPLAEGRQAEAHAVADLQVLPSVWWENSPLAALEALAAGVPVIASDLGGVSEVLAAPHAHRVSPGDELALGEALDQVVQGRLFGQSLPPAPVPTLREHAEAVRAIYQELVDRRKRATASPSAEQRPAP